MRSTLVVLAAGAGTRYGGLKQLVPIGPSGETLLEYSVFDAARAGFDRVVLVVRRTTEAAFRAQLDTGMARRIPVTYVHQTLDGVPGGSGALDDRAKPWGTGQAVLAAADEIDGPFAVVNADDFYGSESYSVLHSFLSRSAVADDRLAVVGYRISETLTDAGAVSRAVLEVDDHGSLLEIVELLEVWREEGAVRYRDNHGDLRSLRGSELVSMNMWGLTKLVLPELRARFEEFLVDSGQESEAEFIFPEVIQSMIEAGRFRVDVLPGSGEWCGITFSEDRQRVQSIIRSLIDKGRYPENLWA
jgi:NDP-sugar pyrophosphorylase family protein